MVLSSLRGNLLKLEEIVSAFPTPFHLIYNFYNFLYARQKKMQKMSEWQVNIKKIYAFIILPI